MKTPNWDYFNDALSYIDQAEIELDDFRDSLNDKVAQWQINFIRNQLSDLYNKLLETQQFIKR